MREFIRITDETLHWFAPLLSEELCRRLTEQKNLYAIGAVEDRTACGILVFRIGKPVAEIRMLAVSPEFRRRGIARGMVEYLCRHAWDTTTPVVCSFSAPDLQDPVYLFFAGLEHFSVTLEDGMICKVPLSEIPRSRLAALRNNSAQIRPFFSLPVATRRQFVLQLERQHALLWDNFDGQDCCQPLCLCATNGVNMQAAALVSNDGEDLDLSFVWCAAGCHRQLMALLAQISSLLPQSGGDLRIAAVTPVSVSLVDKLLPNREVLARYYQAAWDMQL